MLRDSQGSRGYAVDSHRALSARRDAIGIRHDAAYLRVLLDLVLEDAHRPDDTRVTHEVVTDERDHQWLGPGLIQGLLSNGGPDTQRAVCREHLVTGEVHIESPDRRSQQQGEEGDGDDHPNRPPHDHDRQSVPKATGPRPGPGETPTVDVVAHHAQDGGQEGQCRQERKDDHDHPADPHRP